MSGGFLALQAKKRKEAKTQLNRYDVTTIPALRNKPFVKIVLVYCGWEMVVCEEA